jgi:hypothetical protein
MIAALVVMAFLLGFSLWSLFRLDDEIAKFTSTTPDPAPVAKLEGNEARLNDLKARIEHFRSELGSDPPRECSLALSPLDLNQAIAAFDEFKELRGTLGVAGIEGEQLLLDISFPMNARPFSGESRFLNGLLVTRPELRAGEVIIQVDRIEVPDAEVPDDFLGHFSPYRPLERYRDHAQLGPAMAKLTGLEVKDGTVILRSVPGELAPATISNQQVDSSSKRLFTVLAFIACGFLLFAGVIIVIGLRRSARIPKGSGDPPRL